ncbi:MAG: two-component sensor histidine kinase [Rariglobus sp.]|jgi:signal transduction histidine kinase|nr:two-component sensor histidine kinase [Rariglobus sp.]
MTSGSRRVLLYWVLLLLPTLAVGGGVLWLLGREQARLNEQTRMAAETRREAVGARARLIAENVELLVGDVQSGLMTTLREAPVGNAREPFLAEWRKTNPLVRDTFVVAGDPAVQSGAKKPAWLDRLVAQGAPWASHTVAQAVLVESQAQAFSQASNNALQVSNTRYNLQEISKLKGGFVPPAERTGWLPWREGGALHVIGWREQGDGAVVGVEVQLKQVAAGLGDVLPEGREPGEVYELREIGGAVYQQKALSSYDRAVSARAPLITVPISEAVLPGWEVAGFLAEVPERISSGVLFTLSAVLAGGLVAAILVGGTLLMWQARRSEEEAVRKISFVANVSHEFKTPLTTIRLYSELLEQERVPEAAKRADYLRTIGRETQRLARLVNNVLDFSRLEQGRKRFENVELDLAAELGRLLDTHAPRVSESGLVLHRELPATPLMARTDRDAVGQILINLLDNACKYAAAGGEVTVSLGSSSSEPACHLISDKPVRAVIRVADRGPGVPGAHRGRIFEKFHRVDDTLTTEKGGAGLGLSIARQLARGLGGELRYEERPGGGAVFVLTLP